MAQHDRRGGDSGRRDWAGLIDTAISESDAVLSAFDVSTEQWVQRPWRAIRERAIEIATWIDATRGGRPAGAAVGLIGDPGPDLVAAVHASWLSGSAVSILPGPVRGADDARWAVGTAARFAGIGVDIVLGSGPHLEALIAVDCALHIEHVDLVGVGIDTGAHRPVGLIGDAPAILQGTAGSTGDPKTAVLTADAVAKNTAALVDRLRLDAADDIGLSWLPLYHDMGLTFLVAGMYTGIPLWIAPNSAFAASPFRWPQWLTDSSATITAAPNFAYDIVGRYGRLLAGADLSRLRVALSGGEPIDPDAFDRFLAHASAVGFDPSAATPAYGMAESVCAVTVPAPAEGARYDAVSVRGDDGTTIERRYPLLGEPLEGMEIRVVASDVEVPAIDGRDVGGVEIRGTSMMSGYLGHPPVQPGDWFPTGDLGYLVDGRLVICGRAKEIVIVAGRNLFPVEIERAAAGVDGVRRGGVVAVSRGSGRPGLVVVAETRTSPAELPRLRAAVMSAVASDCGVVPTDVVFTAPGSVPRTTSGKLRRLATRELVESGAWAWA
ncbi:long-chain-fatty acid--ACP ligase MbtM [Williamsia sp. MIQD14]|uniref:long-chain-fatty acid--ACP ligase MbtM n=1 Tax=Williamsia sp. MIQD14 TaxID=3425703 RepID=UPI003DA10E2B